MKLKFPVAASAIALGIVLSGAAHAGININLGSSPAPVVATPAAMTPGWHGDRYYDGHRTWERKEWDEHQRQMAREHHDGREFHEAVRPQQSGWHHD